MMCYGVHDLKYLIKIIFNKCSSISKFSSWIKIYELIRKRVHDQETLHVHASKDMSYNSITITNNSHVWVRDYELPWCSVSVEPLYHCLRKKIWLKESICFKTLNFNTDTFTRCSCLCILKSYSTSSSHLN